MKYSIIPLLLLLAACRPTPAEVLEIEKAREDSLLRVVEQRSADSLLRVEDGVETMLDSESMNEPLETQETVDADTIKGTIQNFLEQFTDSSEIIAPH